MSTEFQNAGDQVENEAVIELGLLMVKMLRWRKQILE